MDELEDFEPFLQDDFTPIEFSNSLLLATNSSTSFEIDLTTPAKRLGYDLNEIDNRITKLTNNNHEIIYDTTMNQVYKVQGAVSVLQPSLEKCNQSVEKLDQEILKPYNESINLHDALKKIHQTSIFLRTLQFYLYLVQNLEETLGGAATAAVTATTATTAGVSPGPGPGQGPDLKKLVKVIKTLQQLHQFKDKNSIALKSLKIVKEYDTIISTRELQIHEQINSYYKNINKICILSEQDLQYLIIASDMIWKQGNTLDTKLTELVTSQVSYTSNELIKTITNPKNFEQVFDIIASRARYISILQKTINNKRGSNATNLISIFYRDVAKHFEINIKKIHTRSGGNNGSILLKNLNKSYPEWVNAIKKGILKSDYQGLVKENGLETRMMLNSISVLKS